jgi:hypothetical protein
MSDYRLKVTVKNARILRAIEEAGFESVAAMCRLFELNHMVVSSYINFKLSPTYKFIERRWAEPPDSRCGALRESAKDLCLALGKLAEDLWTDEQLGMVLPRNTANIDVAEDEMQRALEALDARKTLSLLQDFGKVNPRERLVLEWRGDDIPLAECGKRAGVTGSRIAVIESKAVRKIRKARSVIEAGIGAGMTDF